MAEGARHRDSDTVWAVGGGCRVGFVDTFAVGEDLVDVGLFFAVFFFPLGQVATLLVGVHARVGDRVVSGRGGVLVAASRIVADFLH